MPNRVHLSLAKIADWDNVVAGFRRTCRGKRHHSMITENDLPVERLIERTCAAINEGRLPIGQYQEFTIRDPKIRIIHAPAFEDRVAHHALIRFLEPVLEQVLLPSVFACRQGKGVHQAILYAQRQSRRYRYVMHVDIKHYFPGINHQILKSQLARRFKGPVLKLIDAVIDSYESQPGLGLPIGALTSQHFANYYLNVADRWCLSQPGIVGHCRYMDDTLLWSDDKSRLVRIKDDLAEYLNDQLGLTMKPTLIQSTRVGIQFCGIKIKPFHLKPSQRRRRRFKSALDKWEQRWKKGDIGSLELQRATDAVQGILLPATAYGWREQCLLNREAIDV